MAGLEICWARRFVDSGFVAQALGLQVVHLWLQVFGDLYTLNSKLNHQLEAVFQ